MKTHRLPAAPPDEDGLADLLALIRARFYAPDRPALFHRDRRRLLHALSWPAAWFAHRGLTCAPARYRQLLAARLDAIAVHGDPRRYGAYFPTYLLKCLQDWFRHHGDELDTELKHLRNALDCVLASPALAATVRRDAQLLETLATAHRLLRPSTPRPPRDDARQLTLF
jgi:hypothetical protein